MEALTNQEEVELRSKIEALGLEVTKVPVQSEQLDEVCGSPLETFFKVNIFFFPSSFWDKLRILRGFCHSLSWK